MALAGTEAAKEGSQGGTEMIFGYCFPTIKGLR